jgi:hypothetical protein
MRFLIGIAVAFILFVGNVIVSAHPSFRPVSADLQKPDDLPEGEGKQVLLDACAGCHEVREVIKFKGTYGREEWRDLVKTMIVYGAQLDAKREEVLVEYLNKHFGKE